jgi:Flp pilus assembly protein TadG
MLEIKMNPLPQTCHCEAVGAEAISLFYETFHSNGDCHAANVQVRRLAMTSGYKKYGREKKNSRFDRRERGQSLIELAISLPIILLLLLGTVDFGMAIYSYTILKDAAQEGALYGSFDPQNKEGIENRTRSIAPQNPGNPFFSPVNLRNKTLVKVGIKMIGDNCQGITGSASNSVEVSVSFNYRVLIPFSNQIIGSNSIPLAATATNIILQPACP